MKLFNSVYNLILHFIPSCSVKETQHHRENSFEQSRADVLTVDFLEDFFIFLPSAPVNTEVSRGLHSESQRSEIDKH